MNTLNGKTVLVTGGSRGLGRGMVKAMAAEGAQVWAVARNTNHLDSLRQEVAGVQTLTGDVTDPQVAARALRDIRPNVLVVNAGATPSMLPIYEYSWEKFREPWETDVKSTFFFGKEAILLPLTPGSTVVIVSSGAAVGGSLLSGGYAGAKRTQWFMAQYLQQEANNLKLDIRFVVLVPKQIVGETTLGHAAATTYAIAQGISKQQFLERPGLPLLTPNVVGDAVVSLLTEDTYREGLAFGLTSLGLASLN